MRATDNTMVCPKDPSISCLSCPFEKCYLESQGDARDMEKARAYANGYYYKHRERILAEYKEKRKSDPEFIRKSKEYHRKYYQEHKAQAKERARRAYAKRKGAK